MSGDHDDATGKSEKQGAISMLLAGPLLPGDQRSVAFCYAAGEGGSSAAARAELTAIMTGCRAMYTTLTPNCGVGVLQYPEECDGVGCSADCHRIVCGDARRDGSEECDDGNTTPGDGCDDACRSEICGNARIDAGEECDDGNPSNDDGCLTDCSGARCGDGFVRAGCTSADCGCAGYQHCLTGQLTVTAPRGSYFGSLSGVPIDYRIGFDAATIDTTTLASQGGVRITTGPLHVEMGGAPLATSIARALEGRTWTLDLVARPLRGVSRFSTSRVEGLVARGPTVGFELFTSTSTGVTFSSGASGVPRLSTLRMSAGTARLSVVPPLLAPTDVVTGPARGAVGTVPAGAAGELCDDGNASDFDACTSACVPAACGDGIVQDSEGEVCDTTESWCAGCLRVGTSCGNGALEASFGEECDDGGTIDDDGCSAACRTEVCGDGIVQAAEGCDDGANGDGDGCTDGCVAERCGDGIVQPLLGEECDTGATLSDTSACTSSCRTAVCGDGLVEDGVEGCDDANTLSLDGCSATCVVESCGDAMPGPDEECDDGNAAERDGCTPACRYEICGDGLPGPDEQCDDGNLADGDGCDKDCLLENLGACGDGSAGAGEQCDDGARAGGDGCDEFCQLEDPAACGDGDTEPGEGCDDGNDVGGDGCSSRCMIERCGDGLHANGEACDDGNANEGDGCSSTCAIEPTECGNGRQEYGEQCDGGEGCDESCNTTTAAPLGETCGNGTQERGEECDDGGRLDGNGCDGTCQLEASVCGNARIERGETCDDGNASEGDGCDAACLMEGVPPPEPPPAGGCGCAVQGSQSSLPLALVGFAVFVAILRRRSVRFRARGRASLREG